MRNALLSDHGCSPVTQVQGAVLEAYNVATCDQYPAGPARFSGLSLTDDEGAVVTPTWQTGSLSLTPSCTYGVTTPTASEIELRY